MYATASQESPLDPARVDRESLRSVKRMWVAEVGGEVTRLNALPWLG
jgi:hypothetical protein